MGNKKKDRIKITELFMAQADRGRRFIGTIKREIDSAGIPIVRGKIKVNDGYIYSEARHQDELGERLDDIVIMILDNDLHAQAGITNSICDIDFFLN